MIPEDWLNTPIGTVCRSIVPGRNKPKKFDGNIPWITTPNITRKYIDADHARLFVSEEEIKECGGKIVPAGAVIINCVGDFGIIGIAKQKLVINQQLHAFVCPNGLSNEYIYYALSIQTAHMVKVATTTTIPYMNKSSCESIPVFLPPLSEQCRIAEVLGVWDESIDLLERLIGKTRSRKQGLMQQLLTGKKRFKEFEGSEWKENRLADLADVIDPHPSHRAPKEYLDGIPFIGIGDISENGDIDFSKVRKVHPSIADEHAKAYIVEEGDIAFGRVASIGKVIKLKVTSFKYTISPTMSLIKPKSNIAPSFLQYALKSPAVSVQISALTNGSTRQSLGVINLRELMIVTPSLLEQEKIAAVLSAADEEISTLEKQLAAYKQQKLGLMQQLLTGKIRVGMI